MEVVVFVLEEVVSLVMVLEYGLRLFAHVHKLYRCIGGLTVLT